MVSSNIWQSPAFYLHLTAALHYMVAEYYYSNFMKLPEHGPYAIFHTCGGRYKFLTVWNMLFQATFFWICLVNDLLGTNEVEPVSKPFVRLLRDFLHASIGFPLSMLVGSSFWTLWYIDRELVFPSALDQLFPCWLNHSMHTTIMVYTVLHSFTCYNQYPTRMIGLSTLMSVVAIYITGLIGVHLKSGMWTYPIFEILTWPQRMLFLSVSISALLFWYFIGEFTNKFLWRVPEDSLKYRQKTI